jgi:hypothetical protein
VVDIEEITNEWREKLSKKEQEYMDAQITGTWARKGRVYDLLWNEEDWREFQVLMEKWAHKHHYSLAWYHMKVLWSHVNEPVLVLNTTLPQPNLTGDSEMYW